MEGELQLAEPALSQLPRCLQGQQISGRRNKGTSQVEKSHKEGEGENKLAWGIRMCQLNPYSHPKAWH